MRKVRLKSLRTNGGFLERCSVDFSPRLTCIIGARGTCKSTVVESIRFAFNSDSERIKNLVEPNGMIRKTLGAASVRCVVEVDEDGRTAEYTVDRELDGAPRVMANGVKDALADDLLCEIEIYSQGALQQIASADKPQLRLQLIDRANQNEIRQIKERIGKNIDELRILGSRLRTLRGEIEKSRLEIRDVEQLRAELGRVTGTRPELPPSLEEQHTLYVQRQHALETINELQILQQKAVSDLQRLLGQREKVSSLRRSLEELSSIESGAAQQLINQLDEALAAVAGSSDAIARIPIKDHLRTASAAFEKDNETYYQLRQQEQVLSESLKREDALRRRVAQLEKIERDVKQLEKDHEELSRRRRGVRADVAQLRDAIFEMRVREVDEINQQFGEVILLSVKRAAHSRPFVSRLSELLAGSRIRTQDNIAEELATNLSPIDLLEVIEEGDAQRLATLLSRDLGQVARLTTYLRDHPDLYDLEAQLFDDSLEITMFDQGQPKPVEDLSEGQRATALLPLILRSSPYPLIVDQPEDDLDNSFIFQVLVKNILRLKNQRQLIFVTHNANIPVLGDSEEIVVMHMDRPTKAAPARAGTLEERKEDILLLLEGGKEAFEYRELRYRPLLK
jgi:chromosome segregation ATPase